MAVLESSMEKKKSPKHSPKSKKKTLLLVQDLNYARNLAANEEKVRNRSLKYLKKYLEQRSKASLYNSTAELRRDISTYKSFLCNLVYRQLFLLALTENNLKVLWKGLFYAMWMSDKPLVQEECAENIAHLIHCLQFNEAMLFFKIGLVTLQNEWIGIDQLRLDKFLMFVRRILRQALFVLKKFNFKKQSNEIFAKILEDTILSITKEPPLGLFMHFTEIYLEEVAKVSDGKLQPSRTLDLLKPYITKLAFTNDNRVIQWINKFIFTYLMKQHKLGLEYEDKYNIWKSQKFEGSINQIQKVLVSDKEWEEEQDSDNEEPNQFSMNKPLDPRAGRVDVELPQIIFNAKDIAEALLEPKSDPRTSKNTRNHLSIWAERYQKLYNGIYPLGVKKLDSKKRKNLDSYDTNINKAAKRLIKFEQQLLAKEGGKNKRKRDVSESKDKELDSAIPKKKKKKNLQAENTSKDDNSSSKKKSNKEIYESVKKSYDAVTNKTKMKENTSENKSSKKTKLLGLKSAKDKDELRQKIKDKKLKQKKSTSTTGSMSNEDYYYCFERNSGVWYVTSEVIDKNASSSPVLDQLTTLATKKQNQRTSRGSPTVDALNRPSKDATVNEGDGGYEIFIPSKKFVKKLKKTKSDEEVEQVLSKLRGKSRTSINSLSRRQNPNEITPKKSTTKPGSPKKVIINTKLNVSQEIDDHILQVISSPQVPWDSSRKPGKPLLKTPVKASPINPFYRLKTF